MPKTVDLKTSRLKNLDVQDIKSKIQAVTDPNAKALLITLFKMVLGVK